MSRNDTQIGKRVSREDGTKTLSLEDFEARRSQSFWRELRGLLGALDAQIEAFNAETDVR